MRTESINVAGRRMALAACFALCCAAVCGCGKSRSGPPGAEMLPVTGKVTMDGEPLSGADVVFTTAEGVSFAGRTKEDGSYQLTGLAGANRSCKGKCKVIINRLLKPDGTLPGPDEPPAMSFAAESLPDKYAMADFSELSADVPEGGGTFDFPLKSK